LKLNRKWHRGRRAVSGIIASVILFAMLFSVGTGFFMFVNQNDQLYNFSLVNRANSIQSGIQEDLTVSGSTLSNGNIGLSIANVGGIAVNVTSVLVLNSTRSILLFLAKAPVSARNTVNPALPIAISTGITVSSIDTTQHFTSGKSFVLEVVTQRGSVFSATYPPAANVLAAQALSSGALGDVYITFHSYNFYTVASCGGNQCLTKVGPAFAITNAQANLNLAFSLQVTDLNQNQQNITLDKYTSLFQLYAPSGGGGRTSNINWYIVSNTSNTVHPFTALTLFYNTPVTLVFEANAAGGTSPQSPGFSSTPVFVFILMHGCQNVNQGQCSISASNYGQSVPFVTTVYY
jgi:flagellin-like protein